MPMDQPEAERRIVQNTNDILSIYDLLAGMEGTLAKHTIQLSNVQHQLDAQSATLDAQSATLDAHSAKLEANDARFDAVDARLDTLDTKLDEVLRRLPG